MGILGYEILFLAITVIFFQLAFNPGKPMREYILGGKILENYHKKLGLYYDRCPV